MDLLTILTADYANIAVGDKLNVNGNIQKHNCQAVPCPTSHHAPW